MKLIIRMEAEAEIAETFRWYEQRRPGLGAEFVSVLDTTFASIQQQPNTRPLIYKNVRRALLSRFPYSVFYILEEHAVIVLACFHTSRNPAAWRERADDN